MKTWAGQRIMKYITECAAAVLKLPAIRTLSPIRMSVQRSEKCLGKNMPTAYGLG